VFTVITFVGIAASLAIDAVLAADAKLAMKRADLTLDYVSRVTGIPLQRLSDQLNGKTPFTGFWRFFTGEMRETDFFHEFMEIQCRRMGGTYCPTGLGELVDSVRTLVEIAGEKKRMAKASFAAAVLQKEQVS
jgi:hypothetical protein